MRGELDEVDLKILALLQEDARMPFVKIAERLGVSDATIHIRVRNLERQGVIRKFTVVLDDAKVGKPLTTYVLIRVDPGTVDEVCAKLSQIDDVAEVHEVHERYDVLVKVRGDSLNGFRDTLTQQIRAIPNVLGSETYTVYKTWKEDVGVLVA